MLRVCSCGAARYLARRSGCGPHLEYHAAERSVVEPLRSFLFLLIPDIDNGKNLASYHMQGVTGRRHSPCDEPVNMALLYVYINIVVLFALYMLINKAILFYSILFYSILFY